MTELPPVRAARIPMTDTYHGVDVTEDYRWLEDASIARAVVAGVPVMDSLRAETTTNGRFNTPEYGTVEDPELFTVLLAYSPYHNVVDGTAYPAVLLTAGENDTRVDAWHAKKMTARLQEATSSDRPVLLRLESTGHLAGHSPSPSTRQQTGTLSASTS
jgi:prolyl oligopeptidase PreP (S9A serine peptidase family)